MKNGRIESIKSKLDLAIFAAAVVVVVLPRRQDRRRRSGECVYVVVASGWAGLFVSGLRRSDECVSSLARFPALKNKIKFKLCERKATGKADGASEPLDAL
jgi:hypothetical protein